jgi:DUF4097 and DUF4098 domain-containing protein YvlB
MRRAGRLPEMAGHTFHTPQPVELVVKVAAGDIDVETVDGEESSVVVEGPDKLVDQTIVKLVGSRLSVELRNKGIGVSIRELISSGGGRLHVRALVPSASAAELATASADMHLRGRYASLSAASVSGDLDVEGEVDGDAEVKTVSGSARLQRIGGELRANSVSGDVSASFVGGDVTVASVSGDVRVGSAREGTFSAQSVSGDIQLGVPPGTNVDVDAGSASGVLMSEVPLASAPGAGGDGPMLVVRGKTVSGSFRLVRSA